ncbi:MAG: hypothetical protein RBR13_02505 [Tenuifilaceae bacterium]|nr:hypothetical protein [Tenuifilaceae bacterium]
MPHESTRAAAGENTFIIVTAHEKNGFAELKVCAAAGTSIGLY